MSLLPLKDSIPKTVSKVRKLMGFLNYYHRYTQNFSRIEKPIFALVETPAECCEEMKKQTLRKDTGQLSLKCPVDWTNTHQSALQNLIDCLTSAPVMAYPDFEEPFVLHTDASTMGWVKCCTSIRLMFFVLLHTVSKPPPLQKVGISSAEMGCM